MGRIEGSRGSASFFCFSVRFARCSEICTCYVYFYQLYRAYCPHLGGRLLKLVHLVQNCVSLVSVQRQMFPIDKNIYGLHIFF